MIISDITSYLNALDLISEDYGIIKHLIGPIRQHSDPNLISYGVSTTSIASLSYGDKYPPYFSPIIKSSGCGFDNDSAVMSTIGEVIERYCALIYDESDFITTSYDNIVGKTIDIESYALFHPTQYSLADFELRPLTHDTELTWTKAIDLTNGKEVLCPVQFIYLGYAKDKIQINFPTPTGLAVHSDPYKAILNCLYESVERDSFTITWENEIVPPKIEIDETIANFISEYFPVEYEWNIFDMTYDIKLPTVLCMCFGESEHGDFVIVSAATRSDYSSAIKKAILEAGQGIPFIRWQLDERHDWNPKDFSEIKSFEEHPLFYQKNKDIWGIFEKYRKSQATKTYRILDEHLNKLDEKNEVNRIIADFRDMGYNVLYKDLTTADIKDKGFYAVRIYIPQLIQLGGVYPYYYKGGKRLYEVPIEFGFNKKNITELNPFPHPFP